MRRDLVLLCLLAFPLALAAEEAEVLSWTILPPEVCLLPGEPMELTLRLTNVSEGDLQVLIRPDHPPWGMEWGARLVSPAGEDLSCCVMGHPRTVADADWQAMCPTRALHRGESWETRVPLSGLFVCCPLDRFREGRYRLNVQGRLYVRSGGASAREVELGATVAVEVRKPEGKDAEFLEAVKEAVRAYEAEGGMKWRGKPVAWQDVLIQRRFGVDVASLLSRFPTSTYAGYVLAKKVPDYANPLFHPVPPEEQVRRSRDEGRTVVSFPEKDFEAYFFRLDRFLKGGNVPENLRSKLYGFYGDLLVQRGRFAEAEEAFRKAVEREPADATGRAYYLRSQAFLAALEEGKADGPSGERRSVTPPQETKSHR